MPLDIPVKESIKIPEGKHTGTISKLALRTDPYEYVDVWVALDDVKDSKGNSVEIKEGCPASITKNSKLGKLLNRFGMSGAELKEAHGKNVDIEQWLKTGTAVKLMTVNKPDERTGFEFARVEEDSLKPAE